MNWSPADDTIQTWTPKGGWNPCLSEKEKIKAVHLFFFFMNQKRYPVPQAETLVHMALWKQKYPSMKYSQEQEHALSYAMKPVLFVRK